MRCNAPPAELRFRRRNRGRHQLRGDFAIAANPAIATGESNKRMGFLARSIRIHAVCRYYNANLPLCKGADRAESGCAYVPSPDRPGIWRERTFLKKFDQSA